MQHFSRRTLLGSAPLLVASTALAATQPSAKQKVIVAGGHPGDPEYGCGGTIARMAEAGADVILLYLNRGDPQEEPGKVRPFPRVAEATKACEILKARPMFLNQIDGAAVVDRAHYEAVRALIVAEKPEAIFTHWPLDNHADHRAMSMLCYDAWHAMKPRCALFFYEVSNGEDTTCFSPSEYVDVSRTAARKRESCFAHASQSPERYYAMQESVMRFRGIETGASHAEGFIRHPLGAAFELPGRQSA